MPLRRGRYLGDRGRAAGQEDLWGHVGRERLGQGAQLRESSYNARPRSGAAAVGAGALASGPWEALTQVNTSQVNCLWNLPRTHAELRSGPQGGKKASSTHKPQRPRRREDGHTSDPRTNIFTHKGDTGVLANGRAAGQRDGEVADQTAKSEEVLKQNPPRPGPQGPGWNPEPVHGVGSWRG